MSFFAPSDIAELDAVRDAAMDHRIRVERPPEEDGLGRPEGEAALVYEGPAHVTEGAVLRRTRDGQAFKVGDGEGIVPSEQPASEFRPGDEVTVTWEDGSEQKATIAETSRPGNTFVLSYS